MAKIIRLEREEIPNYGECGCGSDTFLLHVDDEDPPNVIALECAGCRGVAEFEDEEVIVFEPEPGR
ncbi:MAG: hypothetical protein ACFFCW_00200 [Candidatus Hodarchaeota archaeon]